MFENLDEVCCYRGKQKNRDNAPAKKFGNFRPEPYKKVHRSVHVPDNYAEQIRNRAKLPLSGPALPNVRRGSTKTKVSNTYAVVREAPLSKIENETGELYGITQDDLTFLALMKKPAKPI
jgi:hypothetical protein